MSARDSRRAPFCWQSIAALSAIRGRFEGEERTSALAIYETITEVANRLRDSGHDRGFEASRREIARDAGTTPRTLDKYVKAFEAIGVLEVDRRRVGGLNLPNVWHLVEPGQGGATSGGSASQFTTPLEQPDAPPSGNQTHHPGETNDTRLQEERQEGKEDPQPPAAEALPRVTYNGKRVDADTVSTAIHLLQVFNTAKGGRKIGATTADGNGSPAVKQIVGAMRMRPDITAEQWEAAIHRTFAAPPHWIEDRPIQLGDVFGPKAADTALDETPRAGRRNRAGHTPSEVARVSDKYAGMTR